MQFFIRFMLLATGFCLFTFGLLEWQAEGFVLSGLLPFTDHYRWQGLHYLMVGLAMIPPSLFEIYTLERQAQQVSKEADQTPGPRSTGSPQDG